VDLVVLTAAVGSTGSSIAAGEVDGAVVAYAGGSSSSLHDKRKLWKQDKKDAIKQNDYNTYDASISKYSTSSTITGALPAAAELEEAISLTCFCFLSTPASSASAGGGDVDELVSSSDSSTLSSS
jgi:hypothetical protein